MTKVPKFTGLRRCVQDDLKTLPTRRSDEVSRTVGWHLNQIFFGKFVRDAVACGIKNLGVDHVFEEDVSVILETFLQHRSIS
jgi:hypothetical protein